MTEELTNGNTPALFECGECGQGCFKTDIFFNRETGTNICRCCVVEKWWANEPALFPKIGGLQVFTPFKGWERLQELNPEIIGCTLYGPIKHEFVRQEDYYFVLKKPDSAFALCDLHGLSVDDVEAYPGPKSEWKYWTKSIEKASEKHEKRLEEPKDD